MRKGKMKRNWHKPKSGFPWRRRPCHLMPYHFIHIPFPISISFLIPFLFLIQLPCYSFFGLFPSLALSLVCFFDVATARGHIKRWTQWQLSNAGSSWRRHTPLPHAVAAAANQIINDITKWDCSGQQQRQQQQQQQPLRQPTSSPTAACLLPHVACSSSSNSWPIALAAQLKFTAACHCYPATTWQIKNFNFNMPPTFSSGYTTRIRIQDSYGRQSSEAKYRSLMRSIKGETVWDLRLFWIELRPWQRWR